MSKQEQKLKQSLLKSTSIVSGMTMLSRIMGFVRDIVIAHLFGAVAGADAFFIAFKIPNFMRRLFAEGAFSQAFVPILSEFQQKRSDEETKDFLNHIAGTLATVLFFVTILAVICAPLLIFIFAPGFDNADPRYALSVAMLRITFPYLFFISLTAMAGAILNTYGYYAIPAFTPVLLNIAMIIAAILIAPHMHVPIMALAWGVFMAGILQLAFQVPFLYRADLLPRPNFSWKDSGVKRVLKQMGPAIFGVSVAQVNLMIDSIFASFLAVGSVSWLYFSDRLSNFPLGVFGVAISTVILPPLSRHAALQSSEEFSNTLDWGIRNILLISLPATAGLVCLGGPILTTLFFNGHFLAIDVEMSNLSLIAFALGLPAFMLIKVLAAGFYAHQDIKTPVKIGVLAMVINTGLNFILIGPLKHQGLALSTSIAAYVNAGLLGYVLYRRNIYRPHAAWFQHIGRLLVANAFATAIMLAFKGDSSVWFARRTLERIEYLLLGITLSALAYWFGLWLTGWKFRELRRRI